MSGKGRKHMIADSAFERLQVGARACWLDADEHHVGLAPRTGGALKRSRWNDGRLAFGLGHGASLKNGREHNTLSHLVAWVRTGDGASMRRRELNRESILSLSADRTAR